MKNAPLKTGSFRVAVGSNFTTPIFGTLLTVLLLPGENSAIAPVNLVVTLALVSGGIFLLNYNPKKD